MKHGITKMAVAIGVGCAMLFASAPSMADARNPKIGFSIDDLRLERWTRDRDYFIGAA